MQLRIICNTGVCGCRADIAVGTADMWHLPRPMPVCTFRQPPKSVQPVGTHPGQDERFTLLVRRLALMPAEDSLSHAEGIVMVPADIDHAVIGPDDGLPAFAFNHFDLSSSKG